MLRRWWTEKYSLPWTHDNVGDFTVLDLLVEFYEDLFEKDKNALYESSRGEDGEITFESTGDPLIDKWEKELAMGIEPDLMEGMAEEEKYALVKQQEKISVAKKKVREVTDIDDRFDEAILRNPMYAPKNAGEVQGKGSLGLSPLDLLGRGSK
jgi:hypothetical protein